jgi:hypothetical protein
LYCRYDLIEGSVADPDPHHVGKLITDPQQSEKPDPDPQKSEKPHPDQHQSETLGAVKVENRATGDGGSWTITMAA